MNECMYIPTVYPKTQISTKGAIFSVCDMRKTQWGQK